jgi:plasmid stabilization system protein ParE
MQNLADSPLEEVAQRMRNLAGGLTEPADVQAATRYADELEDAAEALRSAGKTGANSGLMFPGEARDEARQQ